MKIHRQCFACLLLVLLGLAQIPAWAGQTRELSQAEFVKSDAAVPPAEGWLAQALPDTWRQSRPGQTGYGWYRLRLHLAQPVDTSWAILIPMVGTTYAVQVNGVDLSDGGGLDGEIRRNGNVPQLIVIPKQALVVGENWLYVRLRVGVNLRGGLSEIQLGPRPVVEEAFERMYFWRVNLVRGMNLAALMMGIMGGLLWLRMRQQSVYGYLAALAIGWPIKWVHLGYSSSSLDIPLKYLEALNLGGSGWVALVFWLFMLRLTQHRMPRTERLLIWFFLLAPVGFILIGNEGTSKIRPLWATACLAMALASIAVIVRALMAGSSESKLKFWIVLVGLLGIVGLALHDYSIAIGLLPYGSAFLLAFGPPLLVSTMVYALASQYFSALAAAEKINATLEQKVRDRTDDLQLTYDRMAELQRVAAVATERERLMRDIHDGVGSQLISAKVGIAQGDLSPGDAARLIDQCIDDLRLVIDSLDPEQRHVADALATLRHRLQPKLATVGIESTWHISQHPVPLGPGALLDVVRIVQEALTNVLKHADSNHVEVSFDAGTEATGGGWQLIIRDNGCGFAEPSEPAPGQGAQAKRGVTNMRRRAAKLGASLALDTSPATGTVVVVSCPATTA